MENFEKQFNQPSSPEKENQEKEIFDLKKYLKDRFEIKDEDTEKIKSVELKDLPEHYKKQYEALKDQRLEGVKILIVPDNIWKKSMPSESAAEQQLILFKESYFKNIDKPDEIDWTTHEFAHCKRFLDSDSPESYQKDMQTCAFDDIKSEFPYPNNKVEEYTFSRQFEHLRDEGKAREEIAQILKQYYEENDFLFFDKLLDKVYKKEPKTTPEELEKAGVKPSFKEKLVDFPVRVLNLDLLEGYSMSLKQLENNPEKIVKISRKENIYRFSPKNNPIESSESLEIIKKSKEHYEELINKYGIAVTPFEYAVDMDEEEKESVLYSISDKIYGDNLLTKFKEFKSDENIKEVENLLIALTNYFEDKFYNDDYFLEDVGNLSNYMYGHRKGENKDRIYFVDIEPVLSDLNSLEKRKHFYSRMKESFYPHIEYAEKEMGVNLTNVRKEYSDFIEGVKKTLEKIDSKTESQEIQGERLI